MSSQIEHLVGVVETALFEQPRKTEEELRSMIAGLAEVIAPDLDADGIEQVARTIEVNQGIKAGLAAIVDSEEFVPWLDDLKPEIEPYY